MLGWIGQQLAAPFKGLLNLANPLPNNVQQITPDLVRGFFVPGPANMVGDKILSTVYSPPYSGPGDLDRDQCETPVIRAQYNAMYRQEPSIRSAIRGKVDAISCQEVSVQPFDKTKPIDRLAADFCKWAVEETDHGWDGLFDLMLTPAFINGVSYAEKSLEPKEWPQQHELRTDYVWGLKQVRSLDPYWIRLQLDVFWNVTAVVNLVRGLQYYSPDNVLLYTHNPLYHNPFGQSDIRACYRAANIIQDAYQAWYIATKVYGEPYMVAKTKKDRIAILNTVMQALRGSGYAVIDKEDEIEAINLAAATGTSAFGELIKTLREDVFLAVRGAYTPFLEGQGGSGAHNDTEVSEDQANTTELASIKRSCRVIRRQLFPWLVGPNFPKGTGLPFLRLGGTDNEKSLKWVQLVAGAQAAGAKVDADWFYETTGIVAAEPGKELAPPQQGGGVNAAGKTAPRPGLTWNDKTHRWVHQGDTGGGEGGDAPPDGGDGGPDQPPQPPAPTQTMSDTAKSTFVARLAAHLVERAKPGKESGNAAEQMLASDIKADPERFQFRRGADDEDGTARELPDEKFDAKKCKPLGVWTDHDDGETYVVDGHHRLAWAERDGAKELPVWRIHADTAEHAKAIGKAANGKAKSKTFADDPPRDDHGQFAPKGIHGVHDEWKAATGPAKEALHDAIYNTIGDDPGEKPHRGKVDAARLARRVASSWASLHDDHPGESAPLERAARHAGIEFRGTPGETVPFDPSHHGSATGISTGTPVKIVRPAAVHPDATGGRVLVQAKVEPAGKTFSDWEEGKHPRADDGKFGKGGGGAGDGESKVIGKGSTGDVRLSGGEVRKRATRKEGSVYAAMKDVEGIANGREENGEIITPHFKNVVSVDDVPRERRKSLGPVVSKAYPQLVNAISALSEAGYDYNDPLQVGFDDKRNPNLFDFSAAEKVGVDAATDENMGRLSAFLTEFGADGLGKAVSHVNQVRRTIGDIDNPFMEDEPETKDAKSLIGHADGKSLKNWYFARNARTIPTVAQTESRDGLKVIASSEPLSDEFMKQWEITPVLHSPHKSKTFSDDPDSTDPDPHQAATLALLDYLIQCKEDGIDPAAGLDRFAELGADEGELTAAMGDDAETFADYDESKHPRDDHGRYVSRDAIHDAKSDPKKAAELRARVTKPEQREKLDKALAGEHDLGRTKRGQQRSEAATRRQAKEASAAKAREILARIHTSGVDGVDLEELAAHLPALPVARLRLARQALMASWGGEKLRKSGMVDRILAHVRERGEAEKTDTRPERDAKVTGWKDAEKPKPAVAPKKPANSGKKKPKQEESFVSIIKRFGGIDPSSSAFRDHFGSLGEALEDSVPLGVFKKGGHGLDELAQELHSSGYINVPEGEHPSQYLIDLLRDKARRDLHTLTEHDYDKQYEDYYRQEHENALRTASESEVAEAVRSGEEAGRASGAEDPFGEGIDESGQDQRVDEVGEDDAGLDDSFDPSEFDAPQRKTAADHAAADHRDDLGEIEPGESGYVAGHFVRRGKDGSYQVETANGYVTGTADDINSRIRRNWDVQRADAGDVKRAMDRVENNPDPDPFFNPKGAETHAKGRAAVPHGTRAVSLDPNTHGRTGTVVRDDETGKSHLKLDNGDEEKATDFEPLDPQHSWRDPLAKMDRSHKDAIKNTFKEIDGVDYVRGLDPEHVASVANAKTLDAGAEFQKELKAAAAGLNVNWDTVQNAIGSSNEVDKRNLALLAKRAWTKVADKINSDPSRLVVHGMGDLGKYGLDDPLTSINGSGMRDHRRKGESIIIAADGVTPPHGRNVVADGTPAPKAEAKPLFDHDADSGGPTPQPSSPKPAAPDHYTSNGLPFRGAGQLAEDKLTADHLPHIEKRLAGIDADIAGAHAAADKESDPFASAERRGRAEELEGLKGKLTAAKDRLGGNAAPLKSSDHGEEITPAQAESRKWTKNDDGTYTTPNGAVWRKAAAGGEESPVNGKEYKGGTLMPIHGQSVVKVGKGDGSGESPDFKPGNPEDKETFGKKKPSGKKYQERTRDRFGELVNVPDGHIAIEKVVAGSPGKVGHLNDTALNYLGLTRKQSRDLKDIWEADGGSPYIPREVLPPSWGTKGHAPSDEWNIAEKHKKWNEDKAASRRAEDAERIANIRQTEPAPRPATDTPSVPGSDPHSTLTRDQMDRAAVAKTPEKSDNSPDSASTVIDKGQGKDDTTGVESQPVAPKPEGVKVEANWIDTPHAKTYGDIVHRQLSETGAVRLEDASRLLTGNNYNAISSRGLMDTVEDLYLDDDAAFDEIERTEKLSRDQFVRVAKELGIKHGDVPGPATPNGKSASDEKTTLPESAYQEDADGRRGVVR